MDVNAALQTQLKNIESKTGKKLEEWKSIITGSGLQKHGQIRDWLKSEHQLGHGDANTLTHFVMESHGAALAGDKAQDEIDAEIYSGKKEALRPAHDAFMKAISSFGEFEIAPKKGYLSLRRKKQFAMIGPGSQTRIDVGLNMKGVAGTDRLVEQAPGGMCTHKVAITEPSQVDPELLGWVRQAFDQSG